MTPIEINNLIPAHTVLTTYKDVEITYNPTVQQVYLKNTSTTETYLIQYKFQGNTAGQPTITYTAVPAGIASSVRIKLSPQQVYYPSFDGSGDLDSSLNISFINNSMIWIDMTITDDQGSTWGANMNNQHIDDNVNRILMADLTTSQP